jgi:hypothetical protein
MLLQTISHIYLSKLRSDKQDEINGRPLQAMVRAGFWSPRISPRAFHHVRVRASLAPQPEFVYDFHMQLLGLREIAEKELHVLFTAVRAFALVHPRVRLFALFCGIPLTLTESTRHGFFNLDAHLKSTVGARQRVKPAVLDGDDDEDAPMGADVMAADATEALMQQVSKEIDADGDGTDGPPLLSREKEAAIERELTSPDAVAFYLKVRPLPPSPR